MKYDMQCHQKWLTVFCPVTSVATMMILIVQGIYCVGAWDPHVHEAFGDLPYGMDFLPEGTAAVGWPLKFAYFQLSDLDERTRNGTDYLSIPFSVYSEAKLIHVSFLFFCLDLGVISANSCVSGIALGWVLNGLRFRVSLRHFFSAFIAIFVLLKIDSPWLLESKTVLEALGGFERVLWRRLEIVVWASIYLWPFVVVYPECLWNRKIKRCPTENEKVSGTSGT